MKQAHPRPMQNFRKLTFCERDILVQAGCRADHWDNIEVAPGFSAAAIENCRFAGRVRLGRNIRISGIGSHIANYVIGDNVTIENVGRMEARSGATFGNGVRAAAINENGGRAVTLWNGITAQTAYILAMYRHRPDTVARIEKMIAQYCRNGSAEFGRVGDGAVLRDCGVLLDVNIGPAAHVCGASVLSNGSILGDPEGEPAFVGADVKLYDFIAAQGSRIDNGALLRRCYIGQGAEISAFTATDSLFFVGSSCENGEAASIFAGPFTVSHHKSTLLIAGMFSFFNAGSGANQSNHLFKTGPVHQGIHMRGCKFASDAYVMLPAVEGPFTTVTGRHKSHHDSSDFPFSYLVESEGATWLLPALNLTGCGLERDIDKWPARDKRRGARRDAVNYRRYNPYIAQAVIKAIKTTERLLQRGQTETYVYERMKIKDSMLKRGLRLYAAELDAQIGGILSEPDGQLAEYDADEMLQGDPSADRWIDCAGMFAPSAAMERLLDDVDDGRIDSLSQIDARLANLAAAYPTLARRWAMYILAGMIGREPTSDDVEAAVAHGAAAEKTFDRMRKADREKDFSDPMKTSYAIDSDEPSVKEADFKNVRGMDKP